jgi:methionine sulfoxide reductase heme-binding subunit
MGDNKRWGMWLLKTAVHVAALLPLVLLLWGWQQDSLGANPVRTTILRTGKTTIILLILSLTCTPLNLLFGWKWIYPIRRLLGLYAFLYALLHFLAFSWLDYLFDPELVVDAMLARPFTLVGLIAFILLIPLALTSSKWAFRKLGKERWQRLHQLVYVAAVLALVHYFLLVRQAYTQPLILAAILAVLFLIRLVYWWRKRKAAPLNAQTPHTKHSG